MLARDQYAFVIPLADEGPAQLEACLGFLRAAHPTSPITVISDGYHDKKYASTCLRHRATYVEGRYLKRIECGGAWWRRTLETGLAGHDCPWLVKLDPDTRVWRAIREAPPAPIAGKLDHVGEARENVLGGFQAISRQAARKILDSGLLEDPAMRDLATFGGTASEYRHWLASAFMGSDMSLAWLARNLGIPWAEWSEAGGVRWKGQPPANTDLKFAATHPHRLEMSPMFLDARLSVITTCKGRLHNLKIALPTFLEEGVDVTVVDYGCQDGTAAWVRAHYPQVKVVQVTGPGTEKFHLARARNIGAANVGRHGWWCFWDADLVCAPGWADAVRGSLRPRRYFMANPVAWDQFGSTVVNSWDFQAIGGYDETFRGWGPEDGDFYDRLRTSGIRHGWFPGRFFRTIENTEAERSANYDSSTRGTRFRYYTAYQQRKKRWMADVGRVPTRDEAKAIFEEICRALDAEYGQSFYLPRDVEPVTIKVHEPIVTDSESKPATPVSANTPIDASAMREENGENEHRFVTPSVDGEDADAHGFMRASGTGQSAFGPLVAAGNQINSIRTAGGGASAVPARKARPMPTISLIDDSTHALGLPLERLAENLEAYLAMLDQFWGGTAARVIATKKILPGTRAIVLVDDETQAATLGYGDLTVDNQPIGLVEIRETLTSGGSLAAIIAREGADMQVDPYFGLGAVAPDGVIYAYEVNGPVQADLFPLLGLRVPNFVTQAWYQAELAPGQTLFDRMGLVQEPFALRPGGQAIIDRNDTWTPIFADLEARAAYRLRPLGRLARRQAKRIRHRGPASPHYVSPNFVNQGVL